MEEETEVDAGGDEFGREGRDEWNNEVGGWVEDDHRDESVPDADLFDEVGEDDALGEEGDEAVYGEEGADVGEVEAEAADEVDACRGGVVEEIDGEIGDVGHLVEGDDSEGESDYENSAIERFLRTRRRGTCDGSGENLVVSNLDAVHGTE